MGGLSTVVVLLLQSYWRLTRALTLVAEVYLVDANGRVLLIAMTDSPENWTLPCTTVHRGESLNEAVRRGLRQDLALEILSSAELLKIEPVSSQGNHEQRATVLIRRWTGKPAVSASLAAVIFVAADTLPTTLDPETRLRILSVLDSRACRQM